MGIQKSITSYLHPPTLPVIVMIAIFRKILILVIIY